jgi:hypothetical protein
MDATTLLTQTVEYGGSTTATFTTNSLSVPNDCLLVVGIYVETWGGGTDPSSIITCAKTGGGATFTRRAKAGNANSWSIGCAVFTAEVSTGGIWTLDISLGGDGAYVYGVVARAYTDYETTSPTGGFAEDGDGGDNGPFSTLTLSSPPLDNSEIFSIVATDGTDGVGPLEGSGWTRIARWATGGYGWAAAVKVDHNTTNVPWDDVADLGTNCIKSSGVAVEIVALLGNDLHKFFMFMR